LLSRGATLLRRMLRGGGLSREAATHYVRRMREPGALRAMLGWYRALPLSGGDRVGTVRVPTLHVWSTGDTFLGRAGIDATAGFVDAPYRLEVLPGISHWIPELAADRVSELVAAHVATS
jgi:pimeloyl-ACP methyl ester carboxylesterase